MLKKSMLLFAATLYLFGCNPDSNSILTTETEDPSDSIVTASSQETSSKSGENTNSESLHIKVVLTDTICNDSTKIKIKSIEIDTIDNVVTIPDTIFSYPTVLDSTDKIDTILTTPPNGVVDVNPKKAMTWKFMGEDTDLNIVRVGISGGDPREGDVTISAILPILAINVNDTARPNYDVSNINASQSKEYYSGWSCGTIKLTPPIRGEDITSREVADSLCQLYLGKGYRMAEFHDGKYVSGMSSTQYYGNSWPDMSNLNSGAWHMFSYGDIDKDTRFWVSINDQRSNPWDR